MNDGTELEQRIHAALDRITAAAGQLAAVEEDDSEDLSAALDAERQANAQLEERVKAIKEKQETLVGRLEREVADLKSALADRDASLQKLRGVGEELRRNNQALRAANAEGLGDAGLIDSGMKAELEALRAENDEDRAQLAEILSTIEPVLKEVRNA